MRHLILAAVLLLSARSASADALRDRMDAAQNLAERLARQAVAVLEAPGRTLPYPPSASRSIERAAFETLLKLETRDLAGTNQTLRDSTARVEIVMARPAAQERFKEGWLREIPPIPEGCSAFWVHLYDAADEVYHEHYRAFICGAGEQATVYELSRPE